MSAITVCVPAVRPEVKFERQVLHAWHGGGVPLLTLSVICRVQTPLIPRMPVVAVAPP